MFWIKPSTINVDCFTADEIVYNNFKIDRAREFLPSWWKNLPNNKKIKANQDPSSNLTINQLNLKHCNGFRDLFAEGFIFPSWLDCQIEMLDDNKFYISGHVVPTVNVEVGYHGRDQTGYEIYPDCAQLKLISPWFFEEKSGVKFSWNQCMWNNTSYLNDMHILPAVIDYKTQKTTNISVFIKKKCIVKLNAGDPLIHIIPLSDKKVKITNHLLSREDFVKRYSVEMNAGNYRNVKKVKAPVEKKCPFGFGR